MTKEIQLTQGQVAIVDDWWFDELNQYKWYALWSPKTRSFYAVRNSKPLLGKRTTILMHVVIARTKKGFNTDHINHDTLDNREENLRACTSSKNQMNAEKHSGNTSGYKGASKSGRGWKAQIMVNRKVYYLGIFGTPKEAALAYDAAARRLHGEFACLNFPD